MSRSGLFDAFMYALVVGAVLAGTVAIFLVAIDLGRSLGLLGFLGSMLFFPLTWLVGPIAIGLASNDWTIASWLGLSLALGALPVLLTLRARRAGDSEEQPRSLPRSRQPARSQLRASNQDAYPGPEFPNTHTEWSR